MNRTLSYGCLLAFAVMAVVLVAARPEWVSDQNTFLAEFMKSQLLSVLGTILAITLASVANVHLEINKIEEKYGREGLPKTRENLRKNAHWLVGLFVAGVTVAFTKPLVSGTLTGQGIANLFGMFILLWHILILLSLMQLVFRIPPIVSKPSQPPTVPDIPQRTKRPRVPAKE
ncbi:hypothetical protein [Rhizobium leguminosarum]|uniref:hypothetical protein n=1 Tax=Rhizobium leguminosarum TaxID=384 RepID=UPI0012F68DB6|nr:hypothetical protein [Rhizobium leguminosarum]